MTTSTTSRRSVRLFTRSLLCRKGRGSGPGRRYGGTVMRHVGRCLRPAVKLLIRPAAPTGPGPVVTGGRVARKARGQPCQGSHPRPPFTAHHDQAVNAILTALPARAWTTPASTTD